MSRVGVEELRVAAVDAAQQHGQGVGGFGHGDEMHRVGHEAPAEEAGAGLGEVGGEQAEVGVAVEVGEEHGAAVDTALGDVMRDALDYAAGSA
jgi:hypothetical protein